MAGSRSDSEEGRLLSASTGADADTLVPEIDVIDYLAILWRHKYFVLLGTVLPSLLVWCFSYFSPGECRTTYRYDIQNIEESLVELSDESLRKPPPTESDGQSQVAQPSGMMQTTAPDRFYSEENLAKLAARLKEGGFGDFGQKVSHTTVQLEVSEALMTLTVAGRQGQDLRGISSIVRDNLEKVIPMYFVKDHLGRELARLKAAIADTEQDVSRLEFELKHKKAILAGLQARLPAEAGVSSGGIVIHIDAVRQNSEYLPLALQKQAVDANIIYIEETIAAGREKCDSYAKLQGLDTMLLEEVCDKMPSNYTIDEFHSFLTRTAAGLNDSDLKSHLSACVKRIENVISANAPFVDRPGVDAVPKGVLRKAGLVFVVLLMMTTFTAFLLEGASKGRKPGAVKSS